MRSWLVVLIILAAPNLLMAANDVNSVIHKKPTKHHKKTHKQKVSLNHHSQIKSRYKLVTYHKHGKLMHKYVDTKPTKIIPPDNLYPEATPSIPTLETEFIPNHPLTPERAPTSDKQEVVNFDENKETFPAPAIQE